MTARIVFMGSPEFALPTLQKLAERYPVIGVITQPDRPAGRGREMKPPPVKLLAESLGLPVIQPIRLRAPEAMEQLRAWAPDLIIVAAFGQILRQEVLDLPPHGCLNVHASLLPRWRGAAPINAAILNGDEQTGVTIMRMDAGVDTGPILSQKAIPIEPEDTAATLGEKLAQLGADLLIETLPPYLAGKLQPQPQDEALATYAPMLKKEDSWLDFRRPAAVLARQVRAYHPWPGTFYDGWSGGYLKVLRARPLPEAALPEAITQPKPGTRAIYQGLPAVRAADGWLVLEEVQPAGKKAMPGKTFLLGARNWAQI